MIGGEISECLWLSNSDSNLARTRIASSQFSIQRVKLALENGYEWKVKPGIRQDLGQNERYRPRKFLFFLFEVWEPQCRFTPFRV